MPLVGDIVSEPSALDTVLAPPEEHPLVVSAPPVPLGHTGEVLGLVPILGTISAPLANNLIRSEPPLARIDQKFEVEPELE